MSHHRSSCEPRTWSGGYASYNSWAYAPNPLAQIVRFWSDSVMAFVPGVYGPNPSNSCGPYIRSGGECHESRFATVSVHTVGAPAIVSVSLDPYVKHLNLTAQFVKQVEHDKKIKVHFDNDQGRVKVTVNVPTDYPAGKYSSDILDDSDRTRGVLTVEIPEPPKVQTELTLDELISLAVKKFHTEKRKVEDLKPLADKLEEFLMMLKAAIAKG